MSVSIEIDSTFFRLLFLILKLPYTIGAGVIFILRAGWDTLKLIKSIAVSASTMIGRYLKDLVILVIRAVVVTISMLRNLIIILIHYAVVLFEMVGKLVWACVDNLLSIRITYPFPIIT